MRQNYQEDFQKKYSVKLGFMSFFVKASVVALKNFPPINAEISGDNIIYKNYYNISIAIGPAISIMMEGYVERKKLISLRGTLVPATTINRTISSIPLLGDILIGKKTGEGVFGVSFKIKGPPKNLKTTVNPIKTLTPRFITRTLEKAKKGN